MIDERHELIEVLLELMGDFNNLQNELTAKPPCYLEIIDCIDKMTKTLKNAKAHLSKMKEELADVKDTHTDANTDPS
ncbi:MAG: hypothetical protein FWC97_00495 [Treponema sp.]|nr:hypothetical protein [Treponema sp.]